MRLAGSKLEQSWLQFLEDRNYRLPTDAQMFFGMCQTRPDFVFKNKQVAIYIDGPPHRYAERAQRDQQQRDCMEDHGWTVIRFEDDDNWQQIVDDSPNIFGDGA